MKSKVLLKICDGNKSKKKMVPILAGHFVDKNNVVIVYTTNLVLNFGIIVSIIFYFQLLVNLYIIKQLTLILIV